MENYRIISRTAIAFLPLQMEIDTRARLERKRNKTQNCWTGHTIYGPVLRTATSPIISCLSCYEHLFFAQREIFITMVTNWEGTRQRATDGALLDGPSASFRELAISSRYCHQKVSVVASMSHLRSRRGEETLVDLLSLLHSIQHCMQHQQIQPIPARW